MADVPEIGKVPLDGPNRPASGTYGEGADTARLKSALPAMKPAAAGGPAPTPMSAEPVTPTSDPMGRPTTGGAVPPGVPSAILQAGPPTGSPMAPLVNRLAGAANASQGRVVVLQQLASSPDVSDTTREWAQNMLKVLLG